MEFRVGYEGTGQPSGTNNPVCARTGLDSTTTWNVACERLLDGIYVSGEKYQVTANRGKQWSVSELEVLVVDIEAVISG